MRLSLRVLAVAGLMTAGAAVCGCGLPPITQAGGAISYKLNVTPMAATADHNTLAPANQVQFTGLNSMSVPAGCAVAAVMVREYATWDNPDPVDIDINSAGNPANGTAVCKRLDQRAGDADRALFVCVDDWGWGGTGYSECPADLQVKLIARSRRKADPLRG